MCRSGGRRKAEKTSSFDLGSALDSGAWRRAHRFQREDYDLEFVQFYSFLSGGDGVLSISEIGTRCIEDTEGTFSCWPEGPAIAGVGWWTAREWPDGPASPTCTVDILRCGVSCCCCEGPLAVDRASVGPPEKYEGVPPAGPWGGSCEPGCPG